MRNPFTENLHLDHWMIEGLFWVGMLFTVLSLAVLIHMAYTLVKEWREEEGRR